MMYVCERMSLKSMKSPCSANRAAVDLRYQGCSGPEIIEEGLDMSSKCKHVGCEKTSQKGKNGLCIAHYNELMTVARKDVVVDSVPDPVPVKADKVVPAWRFCSVPGCDKFIVRNRLCTAHLREQGIDPKTGKVLKVTRIAKAPAGTVVVTPALPDTFGKVTNILGESVPFGTDQVVVLALREAMAAKEHEWLVELSGLSPRETIMRAVQMVDAVEGLGY